MAADDDAEGSADDLFLKCCVTTSSKIVVCSVCGAAYHRSCFLKRKGSIKQSDCRVVCIKCEQDPSQEPKSRSGRLTPTPATSSKYSPLEFELMSKLCEEVQNKCKILEENKILLSEKVKYLEAEVVQFKSRFNIESSQMSNLNTQMNRPGVVQITDLNVNKHMDPNLVNNTKSVLQKSFRDVLIMKTKDNVSQETLRRELINKIDLKLFKDVQVRNSRKAGTIIVEGL